jgi:hypothetical protein
VQSGATATTWRPSWPGRWAGSALALVLGIAVGACGGGDDGRSEPTTTTTAPSTTTTAAPVTTEAPPTSAAAAPCPAVTPPAAPEDVTEVEADVDGDGAADQLRSYSAGGWFVAVDLARGGGAVVEVPVLPGAGVRVLGGADVDGDGGAEVWARTGSGASTTIVGILRLRDCGLVQLRFATGEPVELPVGGSVGSAAGVACEATSPDAHLTAYTALHMEAGRYEVTATEYALDDATLRPVGDPTTTTATADDPAFAKATTLTCADLAL